VNTTRPDSVSQADQQQISDLLHTVGWSDAQIKGQLDSIVTFLADSDSAVYVSKDGEKITGYATCQLYRWNRLGQIHGLVVDPSFRRQGTAARLIAECEAFLQGKGARGVYVDTPVNNEGGRKFYEVIGYQQAYIMPQYYDVGQDGVTYQKFFQ
jgi:ribosomal protein S18 acetylase RimI-like enzyme